MFIQELLQSRYYLVLLFTLLFALYGYSAPHTVVFEDDGLFLMSAYFNGVSHPPGYPLHTIFTHAVTLIPWGSLPYRVHMVSAFFACLTTFFLYLIVYHLYHLRWLAFGVAFSLGISQVFWSQSIIAEVYTLNTFIFLLLTYLACLIHDSTDIRSVKKYLYVSAFIFGLGISNHWPLLVLSSPLIFILYFPHWRIFVSRVPLLLILFVLGLLPYVWMIYRSWQEPVFNFMAEIRSFSDFWYIFSRKLYAGQDTTLSADYTDKLLYIYWFSKELLQQFIIPLSLSGLLGFVVQWKILAKNIAFGLTTGFICSSYLLILMLGFDYDHLSQSVIRVYFLPAYCIFSIWVATGLFFVYKKAILEAKGSKSVFIILFFLTVFIQPVIYINDNDRHNDNFSKQYTDAVFLLLPEKSILLIDDDVTAGVFGYYHFVEKKRQDLLLLNSAGIGFNTRLFHPINTIPKKTGALFLKFLKDSERPVFSIATFPVVKGFPIRDYGIVYEFLLNEKKEKDKKHYTYIYNQNAQQFLHMLNDAQYLNDHWEKSIRSSILAKGIMWAYILSKNLPDNKVKQFKLGQLVSELQNNPLSALRLADLKLSENNPNLKKIDLLLDIVSRNLTDLLKNELADYYFLKARLIEKSGGNGQCVFVKKAINAWKNPANIANKRKKECGLTQ